MSNNQKKPLQIKSFVEPSILSLPLLLLMIITLCLGIPFLFIGSIQTRVLVALSICTYTILIVLLPNVLFFSFLRNKLNMEIETFLYGVGFLSSYIVLVYVGLGLESTEMLVWNFCAIPLISLFYTYAALLKNTGKGINKTTLFLLVITIVFCVVGIVEGFEIFKLKENLISASLKILFGLYIGHYAVYRTPWISLRNIAWALFLILFSYIISILFLLLLYFPFPELLDKSPMTVLTFTYVLVSFIISCLIGTVCKYFEKNQTRAQTNE